MVWFTCPEKKWKGGLTALPSTPQSCCTCLHGWWANTCNPGPHCLYLASMSGELSLLTQPGQQSRDLGSLALLSAGLPGRIRVILIGQHQHRASSWSVPGALQREEQGIQILRHGHGQLSTHGGWGQSSGNLEMGVRRVCNVGSPFWFLWKRWTNPLNGPSIYLLRGGTYFLRIICRSLIGAYWVLKTKNETWQAILSIFNQHRKYITHFLALSLTRY